MLTKKIESLIPLIEGKFTPDEAAEIIEALVDERVRFHNIQMLRMWEGNHNFNSAYWDKKIKEIKTEKNMTRELINEAKKEGYHIEVTGTIEVRISKPVSRQLKMEVTNNMEISNN